MGDAWISPTVFTIFWGVVGIIAPFFARGPNAGVIRTILVETAACCYLFYICTWLMQLHPLIGPQLTNTTLFVMSKQWN